MKNSNVEKAKKYCLKTVSRKKDSICVYLLSHIPSVEKWAQKIVKDYPKADKEVLLLSVWLHDIGHALSSHKDHDIESEKATRCFLKKIGMNSEKIEKVAHCARAHRCRDVMPETIEAKILAAADSASHFTDGCYMNMLLSGIKKLALEKMERDYRDVGMLPKLKKEITPIYKAWKNLLSVYPDI